MWTSTDGLDWTRVEIPDGMSGVCALTAIGARGFLAFGHSGDRPVAWTSVDGTTWVESMVEDADMRGSPECNVVAVEDGLVAVMRVDSGALIWTSHDGAHWEFQEELEIPGARVDDAGRVPLAAVGRHVLLADTRSDPTDLDGVRQVLFVGAVEP